MKSVTFVLSHESDGHTRAACFLFSTSRTSASWRVLEDARDYRAEVSLSFDFISSNTVQRDSKRTSEEFFGMTPVLNSSRFVTKCRLRKYLFKQNALYFVNFKSVYEIYNDVQNQRLQIHRARAEESINPLFVHLKNNVLSTIIVNSYKIYIRPYIFAHRYTREIH